MPSLLTKDQQDLLKEANIYNIFDRYSNKKQLPRRSRRLLRHYGFTEAVAWDVHTSILTLAWLTVASNPNYQDLENQVPDVNDWSNSHIPSVDKAIKGFYTNLAQLPYTDLKWLLDNAYTILSIYQKDNYTDVTQPTYTITTKTTQLKGNQKFFLNWLLERLRLIKQTHKQEDITIFFDVWAHIYNIFWY